MVNNRTNVFLPGTQASRYGYINPQNNRTYLDSNFATPIPVGTRVQTAGGIYQRMADGSGQRVTTQAQTAPNFMARNDNFNQFEDNMRNQFNDAKNASLAQNNLATQQRVQEYQSQTRGINQSAEETARQAYIQRLRSMNNLPRLLRAQGITGGAAESTLARTSSNFDNIQFGVMRDRDNALFELQNRKSAAKAQGAQNEATLRSQYGARRMQMEQDFENRRIQAADRDMAEWNRRRDEAIATIPQHFNDFQAYINYLDAFGDPYNIRGHVVMARNAKITGMQEEARLEEVEHAAREEAQLLRHLDSLIGRPPEELRGHLNYFTPNYWVYNFIQNLIDNWHSNEKDRAKELERSRLDISHRMAQINNVNANTANLWRLASQ